MGTPEKSVITDNPPFDAEDYAHLTVRDDSYLAVFRMGLNIGENQWYEKGRRDEREQIAGSLVDEYKTVTTSLLGYAQHIINLLDKEAPIKVKRIPIIRNKVAAAIIGMKEAFTKGVDSINAHVDAWHEGNLYLIITSNFTFLNTHHQIRKHPGENGNGNGNDKGNKEDIILDTTPLL